MLTKTVLVVAICSIGAIVPALAQEEARIFQYSPIAQLVGEGQYRAEVWRRENASGKEERAWSDSDLYASSADAMAAACATLRENYAYSCTQKSRDAKASETVRGPGIAPQVKGLKTLRANSPASAPRAVSAAVIPGSNDWDRKFWDNQSRQAGGGGSQ